LDKLLSGAGRSPPPDPPKNMYSYLSYRVHETAGQVPIEHLIQSLLLKALRSLERVEAARDEDGGRDHFLGSGALASQIVAENDAAERHAESHDGCARVKRVNVRENLVQVVVLGGAVGPRSRDGVAAAAAKVEHDAARADLRVGHVHKRLDVLGLRVAGETREEEADGGGGEIGGGTGALQPVQANLAAVGQGENLGKLDIYKFVSQGEIERESGGGERERERERWMGERERGRERERERERGRGSKEDREREVDGEMEE
jgi:hypothetical protein